MAEAIDERSRALVDQDIKDRPPLPLSMTKRAGLLTGGGDAPGLNGVIRAVTFNLELAGWKVLGFKDGWKGVLDQDSVPLDRERTRDILVRGGTILGTSRTNPFKDPESSLPKLRAAFRDLGLSALVALGGDDTLGVAARLHREEGLPVVGVPKTVDNDISDTQETFGFDTSINIATEAMDRLWTTADSHERVLVVELMGRKAGHITLHAGLAAGVDAILIPEQPTDLDRLCRRLIASRASGQRRGNLVAVSEGAMLKPGSFTIQDARTDAFGNIKLGGVGAQLAGFIHQRTGFETRTVVLGHIIRGGPPTAHDRVLATRYGTFAAQMVLQGQFGRMAALQGDRMVAVPMGPAVTTQKLVEPELYQMAQRFFV